jgi:hypothetical protein
MAPPLIWQAPWLTPNCLNTATAAQSMIDAWNRQRQDQLGMHDTFHVKSYHKRFTEFMITACMVNGNNATVYHLPQYKGTHFRHNMQELAHQMINNKEFKEWLHSSGGGAPGPSGATKSATRSGHVFISPSKDGPIGMVSIDGGPPTRDSPHKHILMPLSQVKNYKGAKQQRCIICQQLCSWVCARCTAGPNALVPLHPMVAQGSKRRYGCLAAHRRDPNDSYKMMLEKAEGISVKSKKTRRVAVVSL